LKLQLPFESYRSCKVRNAEATYQTELPRHAHLIATQAVFDSKTTSGPCLKDLAEKHKFCFFQKTAHPLAAPLPRFTKKTERF